MNHAQQLVQTFAQYSVANLKMLRANATLQPDKWSSEILRIIDNAIEEKENKLSGNELISNKT